MRDVKGRGMNLFDTLDTEVKTMAILRDKPWQQTAKEGEGNVYLKGFRVVEET